MEVLVVAMPPVETRASEVAWEQSILNTVSAAVHGDETLDTIAVKPLKYEDCRRIFEGGIWPPAPRKTCLTGAAEAPHSGMLHGFGRKRRKSMLLPRTGLPSMVIW